MEPGKHGRIFISRSPWQFGDFRCIILENFGEDQKRKKFKRGGP